MCVLTDCNKKWCEYVEYDKPLSMDTLCAQIDSVAVKLEWNDEAKLHVTFIKVIKYYHF